MNTFNGFGMGIGNEEMVTAGCGICLTISDIPQRRVGIFFSALELDIFSKEGTKGEVRLFRSWEMKVFVNLVCKVVTMGGQDDRFGLAL